DAAEHMLAVGQRNVEAAGLIERVRLQRCDAKALPFTAGDFGAVISNSIVHHIPEPIAVLREMVRVLRPGGWLFVRDLIGPPDEEALRHLVNLYAAGANDHQRKMFADSLHAALTLDELKGLVESLGLPAGDVQVTSDRHWTWAARKAR